MLARPELRREEGKHGNCPKSKRDCGTVVLVPQRVKAGGGLRLLLAPDAFYFADPGVGVQLGQGEKEGMLRRPSQSQRD
jgi:hypothetical protein